MSINDKGNATAKDAEGRIQAAAGELIDDPVVQAKGEAKQVQAKVMHASDDLGDKVAHAAEAVGDKVADVADAIGNVFKGHKDKV
ncbi:MAG: CsbD family protein [Cyanobacteria bacterium]|nr:CsbD family protein [Cyanobacteriota bacterium]